MTAQNDPLAPLRGRGKYSIKRVEDDGGPVDIISGETGPLVPFEHVADPAFDGYERDLAELTAIAHAINLALSADALLAERDAEIAALKERVAELEVVSGKYSELRTTVFSFLKMWPGVVDMLPASVRPAMAYSVALAKAASGGEGKA